MEISGANAIILHMVEKEQCTVKRILSHRQHTDGSVAPTRGYPIAGLLPVFRCVYILTYEFRRKLPPVSQFAVHASLA